MPFDPFGFLGSAVANVVTDSLTAAMLALWNAGLRVLRVVLELEDAILTPNLGEAGPIAELHSATFWFALALVGILVLVQVGVALGKRDGRSIGRLLVGAAQFGFVWFARVGYGVTLVAACSGLTKALMLSLLNVTLWSDWNPWEPFTANDVTNGTVAVILGSMGLLLWLSVIGHTLVMLARAASLIVLAAVTPISAAGLVTDFGRDWFWKSFRWFHAAALTPPLMVLALGVGVKITTGVAIGGEDDVLRSIGTAFVGVVLICASAFSPLALYKLFAFTDPGSTSGASLRAGLATAGGIGGGLAGRQAAGSNAATTADDAGRTAGEDGAAAITIGRFTATMGPVGQAMSACLGVMAGVGGAAASMGTDATNQMGVSHNNFPPDCSRRGVRPANGQPGNGGQDVTPDDATYPDDPTAANATSGPEGGGWGGPQSDALPPASPPPSPEGARGAGQPALSGSSGGVAATGALGGSEAAEVAAVAL